MISFENIKSIAKVLKEAGKIEQYSQILEVQEKLLEMQKTINDLETERKLLEEKLKLREKLLFENNCYWIQNGDKKEGPFCSRCFDKDENLLRMHPSADKAYYDCPECKVYAQVYPERNSSSFRTNFGGIDWEI